MDFKKLFQLLVVGGSVVGTAACDQAPKNPDPGGGAGGGGTVAPTPKTDGGTGGEGGGGGGVRGW